MVQPELFDKCCKLVSDGAYLQNGIGSLGEKTLHAVLKNYYSPNSANQEINFGRYVADIAEGNHITEIQTRGFASMKKKLEFFLESSNVRIIYPAVTVKWVRWLNPTTGECSAPRKSPKRNSMYDIFWELAHIKPFLQHPNLTFTIALLEAEEIRLLDGWDTSKKRGSKRYNMIPTALLGEIHLNQPKDFHVFLPDTLPQNFTRVEFQKATKLSQSRASTAVNVLNYLGIIQQTGKDGRKYLYTITP